MKVILDPGHGAPTPGKRSPDGRIREYAYCRMLASKIENLLHARGFATARTVADDSDMPLAMRASAANTIASAHPGSILLSLHLNAAGQGAQWMQASGWEAWTSPGNTPSDRLAECLYDAARRHLGGKFPIRTDTTDGDSDKEARFAILTMTCMPAVLTENLFQDSLRDTAFLLSPEGADTLAALHCEAITKYTGSGGKESSLI